MILISQDMLRRGLENLEDALTPQEVVQKLDNMTEDEAKDYVTAALYQSLTKLQPTPTL